MRTSIVMMLILAATLFIVPPLLAQNLQTVADFPFDDNDFYMVDHSDVHQTAKQVGNVVWAKDGLIGNGCAHLDNGLDTRERGRVFIYDNKSLDLDDSFTIEMWFKLSSIGQEWDDFNGTPHILCKTGKPSHRFSNYSIQIDPKSDDDGHILVCGFYNGRDWVEVKMGDTSGEPTIRLDTWYGLIFQYNHLNNSMSIFVFDQKGAGGGIEPSWDISGLFFWERIAATGKPRVTDQPLLIGYGGGDSQNTWFDGFVDNLIIMHGIKTYTFMEKVDIPQMPLQALKLSTRHVAKNTIKLTWRENNPNDTYRIYRANVPTFDADDSNLLATSNTPEYRDQTADERHIYYYQVGIVNEKGAEYYKSRVTTALLVPPVERVDFIPRRTSIQMDWEAPGHAYELSQIAGYNIYRRNAESKQVDDDKLQPIAILPRVTTFSDGNLIPGKTYYYRIAPRTRDGSVGMLSKEFGVKTDTEDKYRQFANVDVQIVVYTSTVGGRISNLDLERLKAGFELGREFFWRHSNARLNLNLSYLVIDEFKDDSFFPDDGNLWAEFVEDDFSAHGILPTQYGVILCVYSAPEEGGSNFGAMKVLGETGYSFIRFPFPEPYVYPSHTGGVDYGAVWQFCYYIQHTLNGVVYNGAMWRADRMLEHIGDQGEAYDFLAASLDQFDGYLEINSVWGRVLETEDRDGDGLPDDDPRLPMDENRFESRPDAVDTDNDGLTDLEEFTLGLFQGSDPKKVDTDGDSLSDADDPTPLQMVQSRIEESGVSIDGQWENSWNLLIEDLYFSQNDRFKADIYGTWTGSGLNFAFVTTELAPIVIDLDCQNDGWFHGADNLQVRYDPLTEKLVAHVQDASAEAVRFKNSHSGRQEVIWDDDPHYINWRGRLINEENFKFSTQRYGDEYLTEIHIPSKKKIGFEPKNGYTFKLRIFFSGANASAFEPNRFLEMQLTDD